MSFLHKHRTSQSPPATRPERVMPPRRRLTAVVAMTMAIATAGLIAAVPATALPVGVPAADQSGQVVGWGSNNYGAITIPAGLSKAKAVAGGWSFSLALKSDDTVTGWGSDAYGQITIPADLTDVTAIAAGENHSLALTLFGDVVAWGSNSYGQTDVPLAALTSVTAIAASGDRSLALKSDGTVVAWGRDAAFYAADTAKLTNITAIAAGTYHSLALKSDGTVAAWGYDAFGESNVPSGLSGVTAIAAGGAFSLALKSDGTVVGWGKNDNNQVTVPAGLTGVTAIAAGWGFSLALKSDSSVVSWGSDFDGGAVSAEGRTGILAIMAGPAHSLALRGVLSPPEFTEASPPAHLPADYPMTYTYTASGFPAPSFAISAGQLPPGLNLSATGVLSGTPTEEGLFNFTVTASNGELPNAVGEDRPIGVLRNRLYDVKFAPQTVGSTAYTAGAGTPMVFSAFGTDPWGHPVTGQTAALATDHTDGNYPDVVNGDSITFYTSGVHLVTATIDGFSRTVSVTVAPSAPVTTSFISPALQVALGDSITLRVSGTDTYHNVIDLTSQAVFTSDWAVDVISGSTITFPHASPHVITATIGSMSSTVTIEVVEPTAAATTTAAGSASALAFTGSNPLPGLLGGVSVLLLGLLFSGVAWSRRRTSTSTS